MAISDLISKIILEDEFSGAFDNYQKRLNDADTSTEKFSAQLQGLAGVGAVVGGTLAAAGVAVGELVGTYAELETANTNLAVSVAAANREFGESVGTTESWKATVADLSDELRIFSEREVAGASSRLVDMTKRLGLSEEQMVTVLRRTADLSAGKTDLNDGIERVTAALRGEAEAAEFLGLSLNETSVMAYAEAQGLVWKNLTDAEKAQLRYALLLEQSNELQGRASVLAETAAGQQQALNAELENYAARLGQDLLPLQQGFIAGLGLLAGTSEETTGIVGKALAGLTAAFGASFEVIGAGLQQVLGTFDTFKAAAAAAAQGENPFTAFAESARENQSDVTAFGDAILNYPARLKALYGEALESTKGLTDEQINLLAATEDVGSQGPDALAGLGEAAEAAADEVAGAVDKVKDQQLKLTESYNDRLASEELRHAQRISRLQEDAGRVAAEAAAEAARAREEAAQEMSETIAGIEQDLAGERAETISQFNQDIEGLNRDRATAERDLARDLAKIREEAEADAKKAQQKFNDDLAKVRQDEVDIERDAAREREKLQSDLNDKIFDLNQDLQDDLSDLAYESEQERVRAAQKFADDLVKLEEKTQSERKAINDRFSDAFADADPFARKILELNRDEELKQLEDKAAAEKTALEEARDQSLALIEERVSREQEILERETEQKRERLERETEQQREALELQLSDQQEALARREEELKASLERELEAIRENAEQRREERKQEFEDYAENLAQRRAELERSLQEELAQQAAAAEEAKEKATERYEEELEKISEQEEAKRQKAAEALQRERENYADRLELQQAEYEREQEDLAEQLEELARQRREYHKNALEEERRFAKEQAQIRAGNVTADNINPGNFNFNPGAVPSGSTNNVTVNINGSGDDYQTGQRLGRSVVDSLNGF